MGDKAARFTDRYQYRIRPVFGVQPEDPEVAAAPKTFLAHGSMLDPLLPVVVCWQLQLQIAGFEVECREFPSGDDGYRQAQQAGGAWMEQYGVDSSMQWFVEASEALQRMTWDEDYRSEVGKRIS